MDNELKHKIYNGERIHTDEALTLFDWDLLALGHAASFRLKLVNGDKSVPFIIDRIINYTNICEAQCTFCAFHSRAGAMDAYTLTKDEILCKVSELHSAGGSQVMLQGGLNKDLTLDYFIDLISTIKKKFPSVFLHSFSPAEIVFFAENNNCTVKTVIKKLVDAGLDSVPGASDLLVQHIRENVSPRKISKDEWCQVMYALCEHGLKSSATMTYGMGESDRDKIDHLSVVRDIQDKTGVIRAFIPWSFSPARTGIDHIVPATGADYLRIVAIARVFLDNIFTIQAGWLTEGMQLAQLALSFGANDMGGVLTEEVVVKATGKSEQTSVNEIVEAIQNAGKVAVLRDSRYKEIRRYS